MNLKVINQSSYNYKMKIIIIFITLNSILLFNNTLGQTTSNNLVKFENGFIDLSNYPVNGPTSFPILGNFYSQPNVQLQLGRKLYDWYGSGDVNDDGRINSSDVSAINSGIKNDRSDVNGDGVQILRMHRFYLIM